MKTRPDAWIEPAPTAAAEILHAWESLLESWKLALEDACRAWSTVELKMRAHLDSHAPGPALEEIVRARKASSRERHCRDSLDEFLLKTLDHELSQEVWRKFCRE